MAGRRLLDAAKLFNASKNVANQHWKLRREQLDVYSRTSTLARAVKDQTDRVVLTAQAAAALSRRFNEAAPIYTQHSGSDRQQPPQNETIPRADSVTETTEGGRRRDGQEQDHHWQKSTENTTQDGKPQEELDINQEKAERYPLPDGTIPPAGAVLRGQPAGRDTFGQILVAGPPKEPLQNETNTVQQDQESLQPRSSSESTIPIPQTERSLSSNQARRAQRQAEDHIPAYSADATTATQDKLSLGHDRDVFYQRSTNVTPDLSSLPRTKIPKNAQEEQGTVAAVRDERINADVFYKPNATSKDQDLHIKSAVPEQEELPEGVNTDVFMSPRIARMLGGGSHLQRKPKELELKGASRTPVEHTRLSAGKDQDTYNVRQSNASSPAEPEKPLSSSTSSAPAVPPASSTGNTTEEEVRAFASEIAQDAEANTAAAQQEVTGSDEKLPYQLRESRVPSSRFGRLWQYAGLGTSMAFGAVGESFRRMAGSGTEGGSLMLSPANMERLVAKLSKMRGAALKLGQMISFQDVKLMPAPIQEVLQRVQDSADYMPASQRDRVLSSNLGDDWKSLFSSFSDVPIAAASIGQVHKAVLASTNTPVAVKIQYPGVASSIDSDLSNLSILLNASRLLPKGLYLDKTIANARTELAWECDYTREATCQQRFSALLSDDTTTYTVPTVHPSASGPHVLTMSLMSGQAVTKIPSLSQPERDWIGTHILRLCLREITEFGFMQTDPNWTNFLYNHADKKLELLDFGASREFPEKFINLYIQVLLAASKGDRSDIRDLSVELGYLSGQESKAMVDAHVDSVLTLAEPFRGDGPAVYDFRDQTITDRVRALIPVMVRERLRPPPEETYSLHRKLSGAFLLCARLGSRVGCRGLFESAVEGWQGRGRKLKSLE